jgi:quinol monooxygenase YgiN
MAPLTIHTTIFTSPEHHEQLFDILQTVHHAVKNDPNCVYFNVFKAADLAYTSDGTVRVVEIWDADMPEPSLSLASSEPLQLQN